MKSSRFKIEAKELYVVDGISINQISQVFSGKVSRKTLYNWKLKDNWDLLRERFMGDFSKDREQLINESLMIEGDLLGLLRSVIKEATAKPTKDNLEKVQLTKSIYDNHSRSRFTRSIKPAESAN